MAEQTSILSIRNVSRAFRNVQALNGVSFEVGEGQVHVLLGHNGAGKTTLIRIILGLIRATSGSVSVAGLDTWKTRGGRQTREKVGVLFEQDALYEDISAMENLELFSRIHRLHHQTWRNRAEDMLTSVGLYDRRHERVGKWSAGMKRKLSIIRALQHQPQLVVLDEPTAGLDVQSRGKIRDAIDRCRSQNTAFLIASQDLAEVQRVASHVTLLRRGKILYSGTIAGFYAQARLKRFHGSTEALKSFLGSLPAGTELVREEQDVLGDAALIRIPPSLQANEIRPMGLAETPVPLEDIYLELDK
jgi:ABC-2 type transport system ATP-binding protein